MTLKEFQSTCETNPALSSVWRTAVSLALKIKEEQLSQTLKKRKGEHVPSTEELAYRELSELIARFQDAQNELQRACAEHNISWPFCSVKSICALYER